jgi:hypothetical protein
MASDQKASGPRADPEAALLRLASDDRQVRVRSAFVNAAGERLESLTLRFNAHNAGVVGAAALAMSEHVAPAEERERQRARSAWLQDIARPTGSPLTQEQTVLGHLTKRRRLEESGKVLGTLGLMAQDTMPVDFTVVRRGSRIEGLMQSVEEKSHTAIGFLSTHPRNIAGAAPTPGVGKAMIAHATQLALRAGSTALTLGAEGADAQGFYRSQGFQHADGRRLSASHFTHGTLALKLPVRRG